MKKIILLRHAHAVQPGFVMNDFDRPLDEKGREAVQRVAHLFETHNLAPDYIYCSTAARTQETYHLLKDTLRPTAAPHFDPELYNANLTTLVNKVKQLPDTINQLLMIGHNPGIEMLAGWLLPHSTNPVIRRLKTYYPPAGVLAVELEDTSWNALSSQNGRLDLFFDPSTT